MHSVCDPGYISYPSLKPQLTKFLHSIGHERLEPPTRCDQFIMHIVVPKSTRAKKHAKVDHSKNKRAVSTIPKQILSKAQSELNRTDLLSKTEHKRNQSNVSKSESSIKTHRRKYDIQNSQTPPKEWCHYNLTAICCRH